MPSSTNFQDGFTRPRIRHRKRVAWPLLKASILWFLLGLGASRLAVLLGNSPYPFAVFATVGFLLHFATVWLRVASIDGVSARLRVSVVACFLFGVAMFTTLRQTDNDWVDAVLDAFGLIEQEGNRAAVDAGGLFKRMPPVEHLVAANKLIFVKGTKEALDEARQHLASISPRAAEYKSAQALLHVADTRLKEIELQNGQKPAKVPVRIVARERTDDCLRVTFRNDGEKPVRRIRYSAAYFRVADGWHVEPDKHAEIVDAVRPQETRTIEVCDDVLTGGAFYAFLSVVGWEVVPIS
jgi:hypothetical protein